MRQKGLTILFFFCSIAAYCQLPTYNMSNRTVYDCQGILLDSEEGEITGDYDHSEDFTFTICVDQANPITLTFSEFCTEDVDILRIFDGPDTNATLFGAYWGNISRGNIPTVIIANSGCITLHFKTDIDVTCSGWTAQWDVVVPPPIPPVIDSLDAHCNSNIVYMEFDIPVVCDSIYPSAFTIYGSDSFAVVNVAPGLCLNDSTQQLALTLDRPFDDCGDYTIDFVYRMRDVCDSLYTYTVTRNFDIHDCPINAQIIATRDSICIGDCIDVTAIADGGDCNLIYSWSTGWPNSPGPHVYCPTDNVIITLTVSDTTGNPPVLTNYAFYVFQYPEAGPDTAQCLQDSAFTLDPANLPGGYWYGPGIADSLQGIFDPTLTGNGNFTVYYTREGCADSLIVTIYDAFAGPNQASCPGASPFQLIGESPSGGTWSGTPLVTPTGMFDPSIAGSHVVYYTFNGCSDSMVVTVDSIIFALNDTLCQSLTAEQFFATPVGGTWSGNGITNANTGIFNPNLAGFGDHKVFYSINGCVDSINIHVRSIDAGSDQTVCPFELPFNLGPGIPSGGIWSGNGITNPDSGTYDPIFSGGVNQNDTVLYTDTISGCVDTVIIYIRNTVIQLDSIDLCFIDAPLALNFPNTRRTPGGGVWSTTSPGLTSASGPGRFDPNIAGVGLHLLHYTANTCSDSVWINVHPVPIAQNDTAICINSGTFNLNATPGNGLWAGTGITDATLGTFDPNIARPGIHTISYTTINACIDYVDVTVDTLPLFDFSLIPDTFCYNSNLVTLNGLPTGGYWTGNGISGTDQFNAQNAGIGQHTLSYYVSQGTCPDSADYTVTVLDSIQVGIMASGTTICYGDSVLLTASASGGLEVFGYAWDNGIGAGPSHWVKPTATTTYTVIAGDGCSDNATNSIQITVHPQILVNLVAGPTVCYNDTAYAAVSPVNSGSNYTYEWLSNPTQSTDTLWDFAGWNYVDITDQNTGCVIRDSIETTEYDYINAFFSKNPNRPCITTAYSTVQMMDYSIGGLTGYWLFGDGDSIPYNYGSNTSHWYQDTGTFPITLYIENIGGCSSIWRDTVCVEPEPVFDLPNAFTPNDDGLNDVFTFRVVGVFDFELLIFDRWGKNIYRTNDRYAQWDGKVNGTIVQQGVYPYLINYKHPDTGAAEKYRGHLTVIY